MKTSKKIIDYLAFEAPTGEQIEALKAMSSFILREQGDDFLILSGAAGTGKSSITSALVGYLNDMDINYEIAAPTGRAARILARKTKCLSSTIHSLIYNVKVKEDTGEVFFTLKLNAEEDRTIYIVDEASMISSLASNSELSLFRTENSLLSDLIAYVKSGCKLPGSMAI